MSYLVHISTPDLLMREAHILIAQPYGDGYRVIHSNGQEATVVPENERIPDDLAYRVPYPALAPLRDALIEQLGPPTSSIEAKVLREWLDVERARVQLVIERAVA